MKQFIPSQPITRMIASPTKTFGKKAKLAIKKAISTAVKYERLIQDYRTYFLLKDANNKLVGWFEEGRIYEITG